MRASTRFHIHNIHEELCDKSLCRRTTVKLVICLVTHASFFRTDNEKDSIPTDISDKKSIYLLHLIAAHNTNAKLYRTNVLTQYCMIYIDMVLASSQHSSYNYMSSRPLWYIIMPSLRITVSSLSNILLVTLPISAPLPSICPSLHCILRTHISRTRTSIL